MPRKIRTGVQWMIFRRPKGKFMDLKSCGFPHPTLSLLVLPRKLKGWQIKKMVMGECLGDVEISHFYLP